MHNEIKPLILVDGSSYLYRAYHALPALMNSKGQPSGAIYGIINMLKRLLNDYQPEYMAVVFDAKGKTFRDDIFAEYKATRQAMPEELAAQIAPIHEIIRALGLPILMIDGVEADDVIGTLAKEASALNMQTFISTSDKDLAQLVDEHVTLVNTMTNTVLDCEGVKNKFGVAPHAIIDYLTLVGDTSDNIPGVPMVGPKTAVKWLQEYGSLANIVENATKLSGKVGENLRQACAQFPMISSLVTIKTDVTLSTQLSDLKIQPRNQQALIDFYKQYEFKAWLSELLATQKNLPNENHAHYEIITDKASLAKWVAQLSEADVICVDTETSSLNHVDAELVGISFAIAPQKAMYIPFNHIYLGAPPQLTEEEVLSACKSLLENPAIKKVGQNIKYDLQVLQNHGVNMQGIAFDTMLESYVLDSASNAHGLDSLALKYLGWRTISYEEVAGKGSKQIPFSQVDIETAAKYAAEDADVTLRLHHLFHERLATHPGLTHIYTQIEMPLVSVLSRMEKIGVLIDPQKLIQQGKELQQRLDILEKEAYLLAGSEFNINSPKQLQEILFQRLNLPIIQKTPTGQPSTADNVLQELALQFELPKLIIEYRSLSKLISTYTNRLVAQIHADTGRIHTSYNQTGAATGRLSSSEPNLQNIPVRTEEGRKIRQAFIAPPGYTLISADYSQIELRLMAHISEDPNLLNAFINDLDIHRATASEVWNIPLQDVSNELRRSAKAINFGLIYGMSAFGLMQQLGVERKAAQEYIDRYFARYPQVKAYMDSTRQMAKEKGYVETLWGRRLHLPDINSSQMMRVRAAERAAINAPLQGSAADIIKMAMIRIDKWLQNEKINARMIMQVHDELVFEVKAEEAEKIAGDIRAHMMAAANLRVPLLVSVGIGNNWDEASAH